MLKKLRRFVSFKLYYFATLIYVPIMYWGAWKFGELKHLTREEHRIWTRSMLRMVGEYSKVSYNFRIHQVLHAFALSRFEIVRRTEVSDTMTPIVMLSVKNDAERLKMLVEHYRSVGVKRFAFVDNGSTDGTYEWMLEQPDIDVYRTAEKYQTAVKEGWMNRLVSYYGFDRWVIITDSDELMTWIGMEKHPIGELVAFAEKNGIRRFKGLTLDTYTDSTVFAGSDNIRRDFRFVDKDSYFERDNKAGTTTLKMYSGGPRYRLMDSLIPLSKYPLVYFEKGTITPNAHYLYPHELGLTDHCYVGILHYKFIDKDLAVYLERAKDGSGFSKNGINYKKYLEYLNKTDSGNFMYEGSIELKDSEALEQVDYIERILF